MRYVTSFLRPSLRGYEHPLLSLQANSTWGYDRNSGVLSNVGYDICESTIGNILKAHGSDPAHDCKRTGSWETFLKTQWDVLAAIDFTTVEVWAKSGLTTFYLLFVMKLEISWVHFASCSTNPNEALMKPIALELTNREDGFLAGKQDLMMGCDAKLSESFRGCQPR